VNAILTKLGELRLIPVVKIENAEDAIPLGEALLEAGLGVAEITFRTDAAEEAIGRMSKALPELLVGAGTVLKIIQVQKAVDAGARFIVAPGFNPRIVSFCVENGYPITPGVNSPTNIEQALEYDLEVLKFFPAEASGGLAMLKAMAAPYGGVRFIPTGGISAGNVRDYLANPSVFACGGSWMVKADLIKEGKFDEITRLCREAATLVAW
jgi:2-dehydro-3-deoxyphosphogluconate aldolase / (4S)-4-hydroxy-2-oxoglutarate aldolase